MRYLLAWPNKDGYGFKPMGLAILSALLKRDGHEVELFDTTFIELGYRGISENRSRLRIFKPIDMGSVDVSKRTVDMEAELLSRLDDFRPDVVCISALSDEVPIGRRISAAVKRWREDAVVLWGNKAATMAPERILADPNVDYVCVGEGIWFMTEFARCLKRRGDPRSLDNLAYRDEDGRVRVNRLKPYYQDLDSLPWLDWTIFDPRQFHKPFNGRMEVGGDHMMHWGCPNICTYCINHAYRRLYGAGAGRFLRHYSVDRIVEELEHLTDTWGVTFYKFHDEDFAIKPMGYFRELARAYRERVGASFTAMVNAKNVTPEKVELMRSMGCVSVSIGMETGDSRLRREVLRRVETEEDIVRAVRLFNDAGIRTTSFNMLGIPFESRQTVMATIDLNRRSGVRYPNTVFFYPLEGTDLRRMAVDHGFFQETGDTLFDDRTPSLDLPTISRQELIALRERFVLYVKMPERYRSYIERSERPDELGRELTRLLFDIYERKVLASDGVWPSQDEDVSEDPEVRLLERVMALDAATDPTRSCPPRLPETSRLAGDVR